MNIPRKKNDRHKAKKHELVMFSLTLTALKLFLLCVPCYGRGVVIAFFVQTTDWLSKRHEINLYRMRRIYQLKSFRGALFLLAFDLWFFKNFNDSCRELVHYSHSQDPCWNAISALYKQTHEETTNNEFKFGT